jgi:hypothetical protein
MNQNRTKKASIIDFKIEAVFTLRIRGVKSWRFPLMNWAATFRELKTAV